MKNSQLRTVIVDDEAASRQTLSNYLQSYCPQVEVVGEAADIREGKEQIEKHSPDLVFLDIEMPFGNGFDLLESLDVVDFQVIFVTAFSQYAIRAIQYSASNYILKPVDIDDLTAAVQKVVDSQKDEVDSTQILLDNIRIAQKQDTKVVLPLLNGFEVVMARDIVYCKAEENFTLFRLMEGREILICRTLKYYQEVLEQLEFLRIHKSYLINLSHVKQYRKGRGGDVTMIDGAELPVSPTHKQALLDYFSGQA